MSAREATRAGAMIGLADWSVLFKARIAFFVGLAAFVGGYVALPRVDFARVCEASVWITIAACAASVFNQVLERDTDRLMERTRLRPLPAGRISTRDAILVGAIAATLAIGMLAWRFNVLSALLSLATLSTYVAVYTPLKRYSTLNTLVGAVPGAAPPLLGYVAIAGHAEGWAWTLFAILFVWQFPHFMAIAWLYRHDYARAGMRMLPALPGCEGMAGRAALAYCVTLVPVSLLPVLGGDAGIVFTFGAMALAAFYIFAAARFARAQNQQTARMLLLVSLLYVPLLLAAVLVDPGAHPELLARP